jgi:hypothetical protein
MPQEIFDLEDAIIKDEIAPLFRYKFGSIEIDIYPSGALDGEASFVYVQSQLFAAAIATEYEELRKKSEELIKSSGDGGMSREVATEYADLLRQINEKTIELDNWTLKYIASMAKMTSDRFTALMEPEIDKYNKENKKSISFSKLINALYRKVNDTLKSITVETPEEEEAKLYEVEDPAHLVGKLPENEQDISTENTVNGSSIAISASTSISEQPVPTY